MPAPVSHQSATPATVFASRSESDRGVGGASSKCFFNFLSEHFVFVYAFEVGKKPLASSAVNRKVLLLPAGGALRCVIQIQT